MIRRNRYKSFIIARPTKGLLTNASTVRSVPQNMFQKYRLNDIIINTSAITPLNQLNYVYLLRLARENNACAVNSREIKNRRIFKRQVNVIHLTRAKNSKNQ